MSFKKPLLLTMNLMKMLTMVLMMVSEDSTAIGNVVK